MATKKLSTLQGQVASLLAAADESEAGSHQNRDQFGTSREQRRPAYRCPDCEGIATLAAVTILPKVETIHLICLRCERRWRHIKPASSLSAPTVAH